MKKYLFKFIYLIFLLNTGCHQQIHNNNYVLTNAKIPSLQKNPSYIEEKANLKFWNYIYSSLKINTFDDRKEVIEYKKWYRAHPEILATSLSRATPFLFYIATEIERKKQPIELLFLPIVESNYDSYAFSYAGAAGIWQIMPITAKRLGITQNWWFDGRRDIQDSTEAALDYIDFLHNEFKGDWLLSIAAYNSGEGTLRKAIANNKSLGKPTDFWSLSLPKQTKQYVPKWLALISIMKELINYNSDLLPQIATFPELESITLTAQIDLALVAEITELSLDEIYKLNPGINHWATSPNGRQRLFLPTNKKDIFISKIAQIPENERLSWEKIKIKPRDTLSVIAQKFSTSVDILKSMNSLKDNNIKIGQDLLIPRSTKASIDYEIAQSFAAGTKTTEKEEIIYQVQKGDSLWKIAKNFATSVRELSAWNGLSSDSNIKIGQKLIIWQEKLTTITINSRPETLRKIYYPIKKGDSITKIAKQFRLNSKQIQNWNPKTSKTMLPGQSLTLFIDLTKQYGYM